MKIAEYDYQPIGLRIKKARLNKLYTQEVAAEKINITTQHLSNIERGLSGLSISTLLSICKIYEVDADYILFGTVTRVNTSPINKLLEQMSPQQKLYADELLLVYAKGCGIV